MFLMKKIAGTLLMPLPLGLLICLCGVFLLLFTRRQKLGKLAVTIGILMIALLSFYPTANLILRPLESRYSAYPESAAATALENPVKFIVVLGGGHISDPSIPATSQVNASTLTRLIEGIRIHRLHPDSKLVLAGGGAFDPVPEAETMSRVAINLGLDPRDIQVESRSRDTADQARFIKAIVGNHRFILVTSAAHMPRSMALFKKAGLKPVPAPTQHAVRKRPKYTPMYYFPGSEPLENSERALHEYFGMIWAKIIGRI